VKRVVAKARRNLTQTLAMGLCGGFLPTRIALHLWRSLVRPTLEYGCEIWGNGLFGSIEDTQLLMGRKILRGGKRLTSEVVLGELGWESHKARRDELRLRFWEKLLNLPEHNITKKIYLESKKRLEEELRQGGEITPTWCFYTKKLLEDLDLSNHWEKQSTSDPEKKEIQDKWDRIIRGKIHQREEKAWRASCLERPKLRTYVQLKTLLCYESYLNHYRLRTSELVRLRGGSSRLRIEQGRYAKEKVEERICKFCDEGKVEDEAHFMLECPLYKDLRELMWSYVRSYAGITPSFLETNKHLQLSTLIGEYLQTTGAYKVSMIVVLNYIRKSMDKRKSVERQREEKERQTKELEKEMKRRKDVRKKSIA
jgi:hypothetical protein